MLKAKRYIAKLLYVEKNEGIIGREHKPSPTKIKEILERDLGLTFDRKTIIAYLTEDLKKYLSEETEKTVESEELKKYDDIMKMAEGIANNDDYSINERAKMSKIYLEAKKQKEVRSKQLKELELSQENVNRPNFLLRFFPQDAAHTCPKCGHKFYDIDPAEVKNVKKDSEKDKK